MESCESMGRYLHDLQEGKELLGCIKREQVQEILNNCEFTHLKTPGQLKAPIIKLISKTKIAENINNTNISHHFILPQT